MAKKSKYIALLMVDEWSEENGFRTDHNVVDTFEFNDFTDADFDSDENFIDWICSPEGFNLVDKIDSDLRRIVAEQSMKDTRFIWRIIRNARIRNDYEEEYVVWLSQCASSLLDTREEWYNEEVGS